MACVETESNLLRKAAKLTDLDQLLQRHTFTSVIAGLVLNQQLCPAIPGAKRIIHTLYNILVAL
ncbi:hypothetical protein D3C81_1784090 [compost metagenome]